MNKFLLSHTLGGANLLCTQQTRTLTNSFLSLKLRQILILLLVMAPALLKAQQWQTIGNEQEIAVSASNYTSVATSLDGAATITYVAFTESGIAKAKKYDGSS